MTEILPRSARYCSTFRGGGFRDVHKTFFEVGKSYRVPGFLATSIRSTTAMSFIRRADRTYPRILWCIMVRLSYCSVLIWNIVTIFVFDRVSHRSTVVVERTKHCDVSTQSLWRRPKLKERWNSSTPRTPCSRCDICENTRVVSVQTSHHCVRVDTGDSDGFLPTRLVRQKLTVHCVYRSINR